MPLNISKCPETIVVRWLDEKLNIHEVLKTQVRVHRQRLVPAVEEPFNVELEKAILYEGIKHPLIAINNTFDNWDMATIGLKSVVPFKPEHDLLVVYGNQRLRIFDMYEHTFDIPVFIADSHVEAILIHNTLQQMIKEI